jgi:hypothetical protein
MFVLELTDKTAHKMKKYILVYAVILLAFASCETPIDSRKLVDEFVVVTNFDTEADFSEYTTYAIPTDTIGFITNTNLNDTLLLQSEADFPRPVIDRIRANLNTRGYTRVGRNENPDIGVTVTLVNDFNIFQQVVYPSGYYSGYYGYGSWYYYPYVNTYAYNSGVLIIELVDLKNRNAQNEVKVIWNSYMGDVYASSNAKEDAVEAIDQAFTQSDYIQQ